MSRKKRRENNDIGRNERGKTTRWNLKTEGRRKEIEEQNKEKVENGIIHVHEEEKSG